MALIGRFVLCPAIMFALLILLPGLHTSGGSVLAGTLLVQAATPAIAVLPMLAAESHGDVRFATNTVTTSTVLFVLVVPVLMLVTPLF